MVLHSDAFLFLAVVCHGLVNWGQYSGICNLANAQQRMSAGTEVFFDGLDAAHGMTVDLVLSSHPLFGDQHS